MVLGVSLWNKDSVLTQLMMQWHHRVNFILTQLAVKHAKWMMGVAMGSSACQLIDPTLIAKLIKAVVDYLLDVGHLMD